MKPISHPLVFAMCLILTVPALAEMVDNPDYLHWANFGPGSSSTISGTTTMGEGAQGVTIDSQRSARLVSIDEQQAVVEQSVVVSMPGMTMPPMVDTVTIPAKVEAGSEQDMLNPDTKIDSGEETLEIDGKSYETKWVEYKMIEQGVEVVAKSWYTDEVPGRQVKMVARGDGEVQFESELELSEVEVK